MNTFTPDAVEIKTETQMNSRANQTMCSGVHEGTVQNGTGLLSRPDHENRASGVDFSRYKDQAKAIAFWAQLQAKRKLPGHCGRCGREHAGKWKHCDVCRRKTKLAKARRIARREQFDPALAMAMIYQMRREVSKLRGMIKQMKSKSARNYRQEWRERRALNHYHDAYQTITTQELSQINHAYENETD